MRGINHAWNEFWYHYYSWHSRKYSMSMIVVVECEKNNEKKQHKTSITCTVCMVASVDNNNVNGFVCCMACVYVIIQSAVVEILLFHSWRWCKNKKNLTLNYNWECRIPLIRTSWSRIEAKKMVQILKIAKRILVIFIPVMWKLFIFSLYWSNKVIVNCQRTRARMSHFLLKRSLYCMSNK